MGAATTKGSCATYHEELEDRNRRPRSYLFSSAVYSRGQGHPKHVLLCDIRFSGNGLFDVLVAVNYSSKRDNIRFRAHHVSTIYLN